MKFDPLLANAFLVCWKGYVPMSVHFIVSMQTCIASESSITPDVHEFAPQDGTADISNLQAWLNLRENHHHFALVFVVMHWDSVQIHVCFN